MNLNREILRLSVPAIVSNVTVPLLGLCDTAISGHLGSEVFLGAIAVGSLMMSVVFRLFGFLRMGTTGLTAGAFGAADAAGIRDAFSRSLFLGLALGFGLVLLQGPLLASMLWIVGADAEVSDLAADYFNICVWMAPAQMGVMALSGWFVGMQSTVRAMAVAIFINVVNILSSFLLVFPMEIGFRGVAYGTLIANWSGFIFALFLAFGIAPEGGLWCGFTRLFRGEGLRRFFSVNTDLFIRSAAIMAVTMAVTAYSARLGAVALAANAVIQQFFHFFSFFMDGYAFTGEALVGRFFGAGDTVMLRRSVRSLLLWSAGIALLFTGIYMIGWRPVVALLTDDSEVRQFVADYHIWIILIPSVTVAAFIYDGFFIGVTGTRSMLVATLAASAVFFATTLPFVRENTLASGFTNNLLWLSFLSYLLVRGGSLAIVWHRRNGNFSCKSS
ncbi:MAG: MATE family efflux transporter [Bacteroidales bacterium]|nr:MATE family efflux transporter [Bacteroidales bacterium]